MNGILGNNFIAYKNSMSLGAVAMDMFWREKELKF